ncbi:rRNA maturation RNase YbeY [Sphingobacterium allocomposti]|jgi:probable rRNA maturation factor|uniref:Endoribonuclease YbeY n=1 Tax=Sphingobacterium allocomposti TaxID=415956 RepID=A0A5S5DU25_9SPHI|nr:rRNA maturation RNase YbeY [Sphingobacterium composti Yoo et al. 2007 non Ten et al. 2007]TYP98352.1 rRNA maturation RNase YbeY [Sphingobacterium composti Yoo et al. 2007 non Ten et al. 2007]HLS96996.1 rRNA maturation RNase YbeY [Sphingobacterium sp.]
MALKDILFFTEDVSYSLKEKQKLRVWIMQTIKAEGFKRIGELNFILCSDAYLLQINKQYLNHDTYTDIVTFDSSEREDTIAGDIFISVERTEENAERFGVSARDELHRVIIHGVLHLCGYHDKRKEDKLQMTEKENEYLNRRDF